MRTTLGLLLVIGGRLLAQDWDTSGNSLLQGGYNFRQVVWVVAGSSGNLNRQVAISGTINFDGGGAYNLRAVVLDSNSPSTEQSLSINGNYAIAASGYGFLTNPASEQGRVYGSVSQGIFVGSSTEEPLTDLFIAAPAAAAPPTTASLNGRYWVAEMNFPSRTLAEARNALYQVNPDGQGSLGAINATGFIGNSAAVNQTVTGARYGFSNGVGTLTFGGTLGARTLLAGNRTFYMSGDGNFLFGGSANGWNMFVAVRAITGSAQASLMDGLYYQAGVDVDARKLGSGTGAVNTYYGAFRAKAGSFLGHQRLLTQFRDNASSYDYGYSDSYELKADGSYEDFLGARNIVGAGGAIRIGFGLKDTPGISIAVRAPDFVGDSVYLNPTGVVSAASYAPFTTGIARGQLIELSGSNLAAETVSDDSYPNTLAGVQVRINNRLAPIKSVSPGRIRLLVPWATSEPIARIQVLSNGVESNVVSAFRNATAPGAFTVTPGGVGFVDAIHADGSPVTKDNPARLGESITLWATGLGEVRPEAPDAAPGPSDPPSAAFHETAVFVDGERASVSFAGLAPGVVGLYHMTFTVPANLDPGDQYVDVSGPDAYSSQAQIPVARSLRDAAGTRARVDAGDLPRRVRGRPQLLDSPVGRGRAR